MLGKTTFTAIGVATILGASMLSTGSFAQGKAKITGQTTKPTLGTAQMPGDNGKPGTIYQLGLKGAELHFTLNAAAVETRYKTVDENIYGAKDERLLVLTYTVHNPLKTDQALDTGSFKFTVVSPDDKNVEYRGSVYEPDKRTTVRQTLKPAQKAKVQVAIPIFAEGPITKIIIARGTGPVLRYDLREVLAKSTSIFATDGITIGKTGNAVLGKPFDLGPYDLEVQEIGIAKEAIGSYAPSADKDVYYVVVKFTNPMLKPLDVGWQYFKPALADENGENLSWHSDLQSMSSAASFSQTVEGGNSVRARYLFTGPKGLKWATFKLTHNRIERTVTVKNQ